MTWHQRWLTWKGGGWRVVLEAAALICELEYLTALIGEWLKAHMALNRNGEVPLG